jgi:Protein of unknown function (DUF2795)
MDTNRWDKVAAALRAVDFPANRQDLVNHARQAQADEQTVTALRELPVGIYRNLVDVRRLSDGPAAGPKGLAGTDPGRATRRQE